MPRTNHTPEDMFRDIQARLRGLERRPSSGGSSAFVLPDRIGPQGQLATDLNLTVDNGDYRGVSPANAPVSTTVAAWKVRRGGDGTRIHQEFRRLAANDTRVWARLSTDGGLTWTGWLLVAGSEQQAPYDLSSYVTSGGTLFGVMDGRHRELYGTGHTAATTTSATAGWNALPAEWRPPSGNRWGLGYSAAWPVAVVQRADGTGGFANRVSGTTLTTVQFSVTYMV